MAMTLVQALTRAEAVMKAGLVPILLGPPGIGKSEGAYQLANRMGLEEVKEIRLAYHNPVDIIGIPFPDREKNKAVWFQPEFLPTRPKTLLFLDEVTNAMIAVLHAAYEIFLNKRVGNWTLPPESFIIGAGNRKEDRCSTNELPPALRNRVWMMEVEANFDEWKAWAINTGIDPKVIGFLNYKPDYLFRFKPESHKMAFPSPRSWAALSNAVSLGIDDAASLSGYVGEGEAAEISAFLRIWGKIPDTQKILDGQGKDVTIPEKDAAVAWGTISSLTSKLAVALKNKENKSKAPALTSLVLEWLLGLKGREWTTIGVQDIFRIDGLKAIIPDIAKTPKWKTIREPITKILGPVVKG